VSSSEKCSSLKKTTTTEIRGKGEKKEQRETHFTCVYEAWNGNSKKKKQKKKKKKTSSEDPHRKGRVTSSCPEEGQRDPCDVPSHIVTEKGKKRAKGPDWSDEAVK